MNPILWTLGILAASAVLGTIVAIYRRMEV
jgi:hypothetical protein